MLTTQAEIISNAFETPNFDPGLILDNIISEVQHSAFYDILREYYDELVTQSAANSLTTANLYIVNTYIKKAIAFYVKAKIAPDVAFRLVTAGVQQNTTEFSQPASKDKVDYIRTNAQSSGDFWRDAMLVYLKNNITDYPTFNTRSGQCQGNSTDYIGGLIINRS